MNASKCEHSALPRKSASNDKLAKYNYAVVAQLVERIHGKDEVPSSILGNGSLNTSTNSSTTTSI